MSRKVQILSLSSSHQTQDDLFCDQYRKRLPPSFKMEFINLKGKRLSIQQESELFSKKIVELESQGITYLILLDEGGKSYSSLSFSHFLFQKWETHSNILFIIGGAYGHHPEVKKKAHTSLSLSQLTFPHRMSKLILVEQIYRAWTIHAKHPYHHE
jgi:23S rRNA (pseudouridine1915-N3)-methyltransferase